ncbi:DNA/RNA non-specific endonuclease [Neolewinella agarilytica]|uniref:DNA/RNA non-specific endonuclease n=1 Tax=Neolewinella agarilytica TaxID=478744 RepID=UPI0023545661|nr:DNA/RNA non-specific endonuclease [Neolewinella agarilytica]
MAKLRRNHTPQGTPASGGTIAKVGIFGAIIAALVWAFGNFGGMTEGEASPDDRIDYAGEDYVAPAGTRGQVIKRDGFTLSYDEEWEQAEWVAYVLERKNLQQEWSKRPRDFKSDPEVRTQSATDNDYRGSGYDRGHLAPFADFAWNPAMAKETFYMSNISPQARQFNQGVWRELEELTRDWANRFKRLYVVTGPVMTEDPKGTIGRNNRIAIPAAYYKVLLDLDDPEQKAIGFVIPNEISFDPLPKYAMSVDEVESITGINFFSELMPADQEKQLEAIGNPDLWPFSKKKYDKRVNSWNNVR